MRVLFQFLATGGSGGWSNVVMLLRAFAQEFPDDQICVVCTEASVPTTLGDCANVKLHIIRSPTSHELKRFWFELHEVGNLAAENRADVIWSLNIGPYMHTGIPQVLSLHNAFQVYPWRECAKFHPRAAPILFGLRWFFRRSLRCSDAAIVQTPLMEGYLRQIAGAPAQVASIPKSVEGLSELHQDLPPAALTGNLRPGKFKYLYVATVGPHKNHGVIVEATRLLAQRSVNVQVVLTISPQEAEQIAGARAHELIAGGQLLCIGWVSKSQLRSIYDHCDACIMPSLLESLSSSYLEAMAWSRPQIVSDYPFARDTCGDAALFASNSPRAWAQEMERLACNESMRAELVHRGHMRIAEYPPTWGHAARLVRDFLHLTVQRAATVRTHSPA